MPVLPAAALQTAYMPSYNTPTTPVVQVAHIETEKLLIKLVHDELARRKANGTFHGKFSALSHYFG